MKSFLTFSFIFAIIAIVSVAATRRNYCSLGCKTMYGIKQNIGCNHNQQFDVSCRNTGKMLPMSNEFKRFFLIAHNKKRDFFAGGGDTRFSPACKMPALKWDDELAELAALNVKQCKMSHDECHRTSRFPTPGQNLAYRAKSVGADFPVKEALLDAIDSWFEEKEYCNQNMMNSFSGSNQVVNHFLQMVFEGNTHVGCAVATFIQNGMNYYQLACNYAKLHNLGESIYESCPSAASKCTAGIHRNFKNLCA